MHALVFILLFSCAQIGCRANAKIGNSTLICSTQSLSKATAAAKALVDQLSNDCSVARKQGIDTTYENATLAVAKIYLDQYIVLDFFNGNSSGFVASIMGWDTYHEKKSQAEAYAEARNQPCVEAEQVTAQLLAAIDQLEIASQKGAPVRPIPPNSSPLTSRATWSLSDGLLHAEAGQGGHVVYPSSYCYALCPVPFPPEDLAGVSTIPGAHTMTYQGVHMSDTLLPAKGVVNATEVARLAERARVAQSDFGLRVHMFLDQRALPTWAEAAYPGISNFTNHDVAFDMDHPAARTLWTEALAALMPALQSALGGSGGGMPLSYMVCNECSFGVVGATYGLQGFRGWLAAPEQYDGSIDALNAVWGTSYGGFGDIPGYPSEAPTEEHTSGLPYLPEKPNTDEAAQPSIRVSHQAAAYYDFSRYMGWRPANFFGWMLDEVRKYHPDARGHIKTQNHGTFGDSGASGGIDRELVARRTGIVGADTRSMPGHVSKLWAPYGETKWQSFDWRSPAMGYLFMRGIGRVPPGAVGGSLAGWTQLPALESELHAVSMSNARARNVTARHMRAVLLLSHAAGIPGHTSWYWDRTANGSVAHSSFLGDEITPDEGKAAIGDRAVEAPEVISGPINGNSGFAFSSAMFPSVVDGQARAGLEINAAGGLMAALADSSGTEDPASNGTVVCVLHSIPSVVLGSHAFNVAQITAMEAALLYGGRQVRVVTGRQVEEAGAGAMVGCAALVIPAVGYASDAVVGGVSAWAEATAGGVTSGAAGSIPLLVLRANASSSELDPPAQELAFGFDEHGQERDPKALQFLLNSFHTAPAAPQELLQGWMERALGACGASRPLIWTSPGSTRVAQGSSSTANGGVAWGLLTRWAPVPPGLREHPAAAAASLRGPALNRDDAPQYVVLAVNVLDVPVRAALCWLGGDGVLGARAGRCIEKGADAATAQVVELGGAAGVEVQPQESLFVVVS